MRENSSLQCGISVYPDEKVDFSLPWWKRISVYLDEPEFQFTSFWVYLVNCIEFQFTSTISVYQECFQFTGADVISVCSDESANFSLSQGRIWPDFSLLCWKWEFRFTSAQGRISVYLGESEDFGLPQHQLSQIEFTPLKARISVYLKRAKLKDPWVGVSWNSLG